MLVLGNGLLGSAFAKWSDAKVVSKQECDITDRDNVIKILEKYSPSVVVNCAGIVPKNTDSILNLFKVNSLAPHILEEECLYRSCKLIQISTNCVFSGVLGNYTEVDQVDPIDLYGISKALGEVELADKIRTSFVGFPDPAERGLLSWASKQQHIVGYDRVMWNGVTTKELVSIIKNWNGWDDGIYHIHSSETISKYDLLFAAKEVFSWRMPLVRQSEITDQPFVESRTLKAINGIIVDKPIKQQLEELANDL